MSYLSKFTPFGQELSCGGKVGSEKVRRSFYNIDTSVVNSFFPSLLQQIERLERTGGNADVVAALLRLFKKV